MKNFIQHESASGIILFFAAISALIISNSGLSPFYDALLSEPGKIQISQLIISKPLLLWINDGLMAVFFFLIGLEIKREFIEGELSDKRKAILPVAAALGGLIVPALIFVAFNFDDPEAIRGWGVPVATDIAFALGVLSLLGTRIPRTLKILLLSLAIIDDICAVLIIALFYTEGLSLTALGLAALGLCFALGLNRAGVVRIAPYVLIGVFMWVCVLKSGIHATIAGVLIAFFVPLYNKERDYSPLKELEHILHPWVAYMIMPVFAFANAGVSLSGVSLATITSDFSLGILGGLFIGKQVGVFLTVALLVTLGVSRLPDGVRWPQLYGLSLLCGIGFTMSLFIGTLAFEDPALNAQMRIAVLIASFLSAVCGYLVLRLAKPSPIVDENE
jgi:NhaA family Na+:H+ antiporter